MLIASILVFIAYFCFAISESVVWHPDRWKNCEFMQIKERGLSIGLRAFGDGFHIFKNIGLYTLFIAGYFFWPEFTIFNCFVLVIIGAFSFNLFLHVIFE